MPQGDPILVNIPGVGVVRFPATMTPEQVSQAADRIYRSSGPRGMPKNMFGQPVMNMPPDVQAQWNAPPVQEDQLLANTKNVAQAGVNALPVIGGAVGGAVGAVPGAAIGGALGSLGKQAINAATGATTTPVTPLGAAADVVGNAALQGGMQGVGEYGPALLKQAGTRIMQSAVKPTQEMLREYRTTAPALVKTLLDEGVNVTQGGLEKLRALFQATNDQIAALVQSSPAKILPGDVAQRTVDVANKFSQQVNPVADVQAVKDAAREFLQHPNYQVPIAGGTQTATRPLSATEAQAMKIGTYQRIGSKYGEVSSASIEAQKALARGLKEELANNIPELSALNAKDSAVMGAMDAVGRRVAVANNRDPVGFAFVTHRPLTFLAALADRSPLFKSLLARGLYGPAAEAVGVAPNLLRTAVAAVATGSSPQGSSHE